MINLFMENMYDDAVGLLHYIIHDVSKDEYLEIKKAAKDIGIHLDSIDYDGQVVKITFSQYDRKTAEKCYRLYNMFIGDRGLKAESFDKSVLKESYGDLSDYLERHLDSWYGRLNELGDAIENLGLDVDEINNEYVVVHAAEPDGEDVYCKIWLGGTPRTISLETFEMLESVRRSRNVLRESDDKITARSFRELISKLEDHGYSCENYYDMKYPESNWLYITKNGDPYEAEFYRYSDGEYELYLHNIHPTKEKNEGCYRRKTKKKSRKLKEDSTERYGRYLVKISIYKNMNKLDYIDEHFDKSDYCFFDENGYLDTDYSGISRNLFDKIYDPSMKPGHVYEIYTDGPYGDIIGFEEVPYGWFRY